MSGLFAISPRLFVALSLVLVSMMVAGTGLVLSGFFRQAIIEREGKIVADLAHALVSREVVLEDIADFRSPRAHDHFERSFGVVRELGEVVRVKVFDLSGLVVWSDDVKLVGSRAARHDDVRQAAAGGNTVVFYEEQTEAGLTERLDPGRPVVEFYVPIRAREAMGAAPRVVGVMALYRSAASLNATLRRGVVLVWLVTAGGGIVLFGSLFALFRSAYRGRKSAESRLSTLNTEFQRIVQLEKLSATGTMVGEIAHQINNPLVGVINLAQLAEREADDPERTRALLADIRKAGEHCRDFVRRMLAFTEAARCERQPVALAPLIAETTALFRDSVAGHPEVRVDLSTNSARLAADPVLLRHALFNLLANAAQAAPGRPVDVDLRRQEAETPPRPGWSLAVRDHGPGVPTAERDRIFAPFYTTRVGGTGLGLSVVEHIALQHGGKITVDDAEGGGARFVLWLPDDDAKGEREP